MADALQFANPAFAAGTSPGGLGAAFGFRATVVDIVNVGTVDAFLDITTSGAQATTSGSFRCSPGTSGKLRLAAIERNSGWSGLSAISTATGATLSIGAWKV